MFNITQEQFEKISYIHEQVKSNFPNFIGFKAGKRTDGTYYAECIGDVDEAEIQTFINNLDLSGV